MRSSVLERFKFHVYTVVGVGIVHIFRRRKAKEQEKAGKVRGKDAVNRNKTRGGARISIRWIALFDSKTAKFVCGADEIEMG